MLKVNYDSKFDILYISIGNPVPSYGDEQVPGLVILKNIKTDEITGVTIFDFMKKVKENTMDDLEIPIEIDIKKISQDISTIN
ncbi:MAG: DUF2283 domain-containing protein [Tissierellia bacterium]|nr:DUF2283 domain-containing protein [Tissierellia bacterium]